MVLFLWRTVTNAPSLSKKSAVRIESAHNTEQDVSALQPTAPRNTPVGDQHHTEGEHTVWGTVERLCKRVLARTYYRIWALGVIGKDPRKQWIAQKSKDRK